MFKIFNLVKFSSQKTLLDKIKEYFPPVKQTIIYHEDNIILKPYNSMCYNVYQQSCQLEQTEHLNSQRFLHLNITYNEAYCNGTTYKQFPFMKLIQIAIKHFSQQSFDQQFWTIFEQSLERNLRFCSTYETIVSLYLTHHKIQKHRFNDNIITQIKQFLQQQLSIMNAKQLQLLYYVCSQCQHKGSWVEKIQKEIEQKIFKQIASKQYNPNEAANWTYFMLIYSIKANKDPYLIKDHHSFILIDNLLLKPKNVSSQQLIRLLKILYIRLKFAPQKVLSKVMNYIHLWQQYNTNYQKYSLSDQLLLNLLSGDQFRSIEIASLQTQYMKKCYLQALYHSWKFLALDEQQILSRYYQLSFDKNKNNVQIMFYCMNFELYFDKFYHSPTILENIQSMEYIPYGMEWVMYHYVIASKTQYNIKNKIQQSTKRNPKNYNKFIANEQKRILELEDIISLKKYLTSIKQFQFIQAPFLNKFTPISHFVDIKNKVILHCYEKNEVFVKNNNQSIIRSNCPYYGINITRQRILYDKLLQRQGWNVIGIYTEEFLNYNYSERIKFLNERIRKDNFEQIQENK